MSGRFEAAPGEVDPLERRDGLKAGDVLGERLAKGVGTERAEVVQAAAEQVVLGERAPPVGDLAVPGPARPQADRPAGAGRGVDEPAVLHDQDRREGRADLDDRERRVVEAAVRPGIEPEGQRRDGDLVGSAEVDRVRLAMGGDRRQVEAAGQEDDGQARPDEGAEPTTGSR